MHSSKLAGTAPCWPEHRQISDHSLPQSRQLGSSTAPVAGYADRVVIIAWHLQPTARKLPIRKHIYAISHLQWHRGELFTLPHGSAPTVQEVYAHRCMIPAEGLLSMPNRASRRSAHMHARAHTHTLRREWLFFQVHSARPGADSAISMTLLHCAPHTIAHSAPHTGNIPAVVHSTLHSTFSMQAAQHAQCRQHSS